MPIIGAAYLRCSDPRQDKSIEQQRNEVSKRAAADGVTIPDDLWFIDEGLSGRTAKKRVASPTRSCSAAPRPSVTRGSSGALRPRASIDCMYGRFHVSPET